MKKETSSTSPPFSSELIAEKELPTKQDFDEYTKTMPYDECKVVSIRGDKVVLFKDKKKEKVSLYTLDQNGWIALKREIKETETQLGNLKDPVWVKNQIEYLENMKKELENRLNDQAKGQITKEINEEKNNCLL